MMTLISRDEENFRIFKKKVIIMIRGLKKEGNKFRSLIINYKIRQIEPEKKIMKYVNAQRIR